MKNIIIKTTILLLFNTLLFSININALPSVKKFKSMCKHYDQQLQADLLQAMLNKSTVQKCYDWCFKFNKHYMSPVVYAVTVEHIPIVAVLIEYTLKHNINYYLFTKQNGVSLLTVAVKQDNQELFQLLLDNKHPLKMDNSKKYSSALHEAAKNNNAILCDILIRHKNANILVHSQDYNKLTPVNYLIINKQQDIVLQILFNFPVNVFNMPTDIFKRTYLNYATIYGMYHVVKILLQQGADPNYSTKDNQHIIFSQSCKSPDLYRIKFNYERNNKLTSTNCIIKYLLCCYKNKL